MSETYVHFVEIDAGKSWGHERRIVDTPAGFEKWKHEREARGHKVKLVRRVRMNV